MSESSIELTWTDMSSDETGFVIERSTSTSGPWGRFSVGPNVASFTDSGLSASTTYIYRLAAQNSDGISTYVGPVGAMTMVAGISLPTAPSGLVATSAASDSISLSWLDNSNNETGFRIERGTTSTGPFTQIATTSTGVTTYSDTGLTASTTYYFRVRANNSAGDSAFSSVATATTLTTTTRPVAPSSLAATAASSSSISLSWVDNSNNETGFRIERATGSTGGSFTQIATVGAGVVAFSDTGRAASTTYRYRVRANNSAGDSAFSNVATATTLSTTTLPEAPSSLVATSTSSTSISLSWVDNSNNETGFRIERGTTSTGPFTELAATSEGVTAYSNKDLTASTTYYYRVRANNSAGDSDYSDVANATTLSVSTSVTLFPSADNLVLVNSDDVPIADTVFQSAELVVGCNWGMNLLIQTSVCGQSLVRFDVSTLSGNAIDSATLRLTTNYAGVGVFPRTWQIWAIASDWSPTTVTWNMVSLFQYYLDHRINNLVPPTSIGQIIDLDVKEIVQAWANGTFLNNGMMFQVSNSDPPNAISNDAFAFYSLEHTGQEWPRLIVTYH
jgi:titin